MSIKTELKAIQKEALETRKKENEKLEKQAKIFIEKFIIPEFRRIAESRPMASILKIEFHNNIGGFFYTSTINSWEYKKTSQYDHTIVCKAIEIAQDFDIEAKSCDDGAGGVVYVFSVDLSD